VTAVLSIGSNLGDRLAALQAAVDILHPTAISPVYETTPVGGPVQPDYLNAIVICRMDAETAWALAQEAERSQGRKRTEHWGARTLDVDLILADGDVPDGIVLPHPHAHERAFVLAPWVDLDSAAVLPGHGPITTLLAATDASGVHRRDDMRLLPSRRTDKES
jgi:2-amino-4-hydroxy-6-hydroxymethyldihydropteridine diphosphokinase